MGWVPTHGENVLSGLMSLVSDIVDRLGYLGLALLVAIENAFPPIPSEVILPLAGYNVYLGRMSFPLVIIATTLGSVLGSLLLYAIGSWLGKDRLRALVIRYGHFFLLKESDMDKADAWFQRYGGVAVLIGRVVPMVRSLISIPAGIERMPVMRFIALTAIGSAVWNTLLVGAGWILGTQWDRVEEWVGALQWVVLALAVLAVGYFVIKRLQTRARA